jgi:DNA-binding MarR family transcriptional regulator
VRNRARHRLGGVGVTRAQRPTGWLVLRYLMQRGEPAIVPEIAAAIGVSQSAARCAIMRSAGYTFIEAGRVPAASCRNRYVLWVAWED